MNIEWLLNKAKQKFYPITHAKAVLVGENNETLDTELDGIKSDLSDSLPVGTILTVVDSATMSSDMWKLLKTGTLSYQDGGALVEISTITYQKIK